MAVLYKPTKHCLKISDESLTEKEHLDSCDVNKMVKSALRGAQIRTNDNIRYGHDDLSMDLLKVKIEKQKLEKDLQELANSGDLEEEDVKLLPENVQKKFKFKTKPKNKPKNDETKNDEPKTNPP